MVQRHLAARGISDVRVLDAMAAVPREAFMPESQQHSAYSDHAYPIGCGQTISQPFTVAFMLQAARLQSTDRVLEIGTGSGYGAAVLSLLVQEVETVERIPTLADAAASQLRAGKYMNVRVHQDDGTQGLIEHAPYNAIVVTAGAKTLPPSYRQQLAEDGRIIIPLGDSPQRQQMCRVIRAGGTYTTEQLGTFVFVPLVGDCGW